MFPVREPGVPRTSATRVRTGSKSSARQVGRHRHLMTPAMTDSDAPRRRARRDGSPRSASTCRGKHARAGARPCPPFPGIGIGAGTDADQTLTVGEVWLALAMTVRPLAAPRGSASAPFTPHLREQTGSNSQSCDWPRRDILPPRRAPRPASRHRAAAQPLVRSTTDGLEVPKLMRDVGDAVGVVTNRARNCVWTFFNRRRDAPERACRSLPSPRPRRTELWPSADAGVDANTGTDARSHQRAADRRGQPRVATSAR